MSYVKPLIFKKGADWLCIGDGVYTSSSNPRSAFRKWEWKTGRRFKIPRPLGRFARKRAETRANTGTHWLDWQGKVVQVVGYVPPILGDQLVVRDWSR